MLYVLPAFFLLSFPLIRRGKGRNTRGFIWETDNQYDSEKSQQIYNNFINKICIFLFFAEFYLLFVIITLHNHSLLRNEKKNVIVKCILINFVTSSTKKSIQSVTLIFSFSFPVLEVILIIKFHSFIKWLFYYLL